jgi:hypothetical protein
MVHTLDNKRNSTYKVKNQGNEYRGMLGILHQNIRSIKGKFRELQVLLYTELKNIDILYFTEHWLNHQSLHTINFDNFSLSSEFCRINDKGGSCIYIKKGIRMRDLNYMKELGEVNNFELSITEIIEYKII